MFDKKRSINLNFTRFGLFEIDIGERNLRICVASKPLEESVQCLLNFAWQGNFARNWPQALTVLRPVKRSRSTYYDGSRPSSFMLWVWCGSSHKTPGCGLVCITLVLGSWQGSFVVGCVRSTTCSEVPATWVLRRCGVGGPAILRVSIWRRFRAETLHPLQSFDIFPFIGNWNIFIYWKMVFFFPFKGALSFFLPLKGALSMKYATPSFSFAILDRRGISHDFPVLH